MEKQKKLVKKIDEYLLIEKIGQGMSGTVYTCIKEGFKGLYACKVIPFDKVHESAKSKKYFV